MNHAIILAAGQSQRMGSSTDKLLAKVANHPVIYYAIAALNDHELIDDIAIVANKQNREEIAKLVKAYHFRKVKLITLGGLTRQQSLQKGLAAIKAKLRGKALKPKDLIVVHNGANPLPSYNEISEAIRIAGEEKACIVAHVVTETIKKVKNKKIEETVDREDLYAAQTPQVIEFTLLEKALKQAEKKSFEATDEAMLVEALGHKVTITPAHEFNFKITTRADLERLKTILGGNEGEFRVGIGQDSHAFSKTEKGLTLGGLLFKDQKKLEADSDGDVILHAIFNSISQALGERSLGFYADSICKNQKEKNSRKYLDVIMKKVAQEGYKIGNLGIMVECKTPKIDPLVVKLKKSLSEILKVESRRIGITATSGDALTSFGLGAGIQCFAIMSLIGKKKK